MNTETHDTKYELTDHQIRVIGVLIEKSLSQPGSYPLTINAIQLGANQKQNRDPVVDYTEGDVTRALQQLISRKIVSQAPPSSGARANRFEHRVLDAFGWDRREQAVMAELMLRGRQTAGELRSRASRMTSITDLGAVDAVLRALMEHNHPFVAELTREPGRFTNRFRQLMQSNPPAETAPAVAAVELTEDVDEPFQSVEDLTARVTRLETAVFDLTAAVTELRKSSTCNVEPPVADDV